MCPPYHVFAYTRVSMHPNMLIFLLFLTFCMKEVTKNFTPKKITVFPGIQKVGPIWQNFIREYPYEPPKTPEKVNFSDH